MYLFSFRSLTAWEKLKKHMPNEERKAQECSSSVTPAPANSDKYKHFSVFFIQYEVHHTYPQLGQIISFKKKLLQIKVADACLLKHLTVD